MNLIKLYASFAIAQCKKSTQFPISISRVRDFIQQTNKRNAVLTSTYANGFDTSGTLYGEKPSGLHREPLRRLVRGVAIAIGLSLSFGVTPADGISNSRYYNIFSLADYQLTEKQESCHNRITFLESSNRIDAVNGSHYGYYQGRSISLKGAPYDYQFYWYWKYVSHRYGVTRYDEPNYCAALAHLQRKGWQ